MKENFQLRTQQRMNGTDANVGGYANIRVNGYDGDCVTLGKGMSKKNTEILSTPVEGVSNATLNTNTRDTRRVKHFLKQWDDAQSKQHNTNNKMTMNVEDSSKNVNVKSSAAVSQHQEQSHNKATIKLRTEYQYHIEELDLTSVKITSFAKDYLIEGSQLSEKFLNMFGDHFINKLIKGVFFQADLSYEYTGQEHGKEFAAKMEADAVKGNVSINTINDYLSENGVKISKISGTIVKSGFDSILILIDSVDSLKQYYQKFLELIKSPDQLKLDIRLKIKKVFT